MKINNLIKKILLLFLALSFIPIVLQLMAFSGKSGAESLQITGENSESNSLIITYPENGTLFPPEIAPPTFLWEDKSGKAIKWIITVSVYQQDKSISAVANEPKWKPELSQWEYVKANSYDYDAVITIRGWDDKKEVSFGTVKIRTSRDSVGAPIFYRDVPLPFSYALRNLESVCWRVGNISSDNLAPVVMKNLPVCANCHSFSADCSTIAMDIDAHSQKDAYGIANIQKITILKDITHWSDFQKGESTYSLLANLSPSGQYIASTLKDNEFFITKPDTAYSQLFFPIKGIIVMYDRLTKKYWALPGADDTNYVNSNPNWTPDSKYIYFTRTKAIPSKESGFISAFQRDSAVYGAFVEKFIREERRFNYDIYRIPFNNGRGGKAEPVPGASNNDMSNYFPKISPDGKWLVFTQAKNYMLLQPDSKLYIMPANGGTPRKLNCNSNNLNSWHSWSPNGKWLVFSSKRRGTYTKLYLTHIDENGNDSPPVCLEYFNPPDRATNIPEFVNIKPGDFTRIDPKFLENEYYNYIKGIKSAEEGDLEKAKESFSAAVESDPGNFIFLGSRGYTKMELGDYEGAKKDLDRAIELKPGEYKLYILRAFLKIELGNSKGALEDFDKAIELKPDDCESYNGRGYLKINLGDYKGALIDLNKAIELQKDYTEAYYDRGLAKSFLNNFKDAIKDFDEAIKLNPEFSYAYLARGAAKLELGEIEPACSDLRKALELGCKAATELLKENCGN